MNNHVKEEQKTAVIKSLAIIGFVAAIFITAWLAVQAVRLLPTAFGALANIIESVQNPDNSFSLSADKSIVNTGAPLNISWTSLSSKHLPTFSYACTDGVSAVLIQDTVRTDIACGTSIALADTNTASVVFTSEKRRFIDVAYSLSALSEDTQEVATSRDNVVTVVNPTIQSNRDVAETETDITTDISTDTTPEETPAVVTITDTSPSAVASYTDLSVSLLAINVYDRRSGAPVSASAIKSGDRVSVQFTVSNIGTQTSGIWYFDALLPASGTHNFLSPAQNPLAPQAGQIFTLQFDAGDYPGAIIITASGGNDTRTANNAFSEYLHMQR